MNSAIENRARWGRPEIMSPAGYWPQVHAAIAAGADAVYFGLRHFSARAKVGFGLDELSTLMDDLHSQGRLGYLTMNTLVYDNELASAVQAIEGAARAGVDALIVQDPAVLQLAQMVAPSLVLHGSTQMSVTSAEGVLLAAGQGVSRVVLGRELSLPEIRAIRAATDVELEMFVHGALCVSYSGQCFSSEAWGGRSANRGQCAQACRLPYDLMVDDQHHPTEDARYLLSPGDLFTLEHMPEIVDLGVSALKIEGRYKDENYVAMVTQAYRKALDAAWQDQTFDAGAGRLQVEQVYSRGLGPWFLAGTDHQAVVRGRLPGHRGVRAGTVVAVGKDWIDIDMSGADKGLRLQPGDGLLLDAAHRRSPESGEEGGRIFELTPLQGDSVRVYFGNGQVRFGRVKPGDFVWRTSAADANRLARAARHRTVVPTRQIAVEMQAVVGEPLRSTWWLQGQPDQKVEVVAAEPVQAARSQGLDLERLRAQLGRMGNSGFSLAEVRWQCEDAVYVPVAILNAMRREALDALRNVQHRPIPVQTVALETLLQPAGDNREAAADVRLHLLVRNHAQLEAALDTDPASITLDYLDFYGLKPALERVQKQGIPARVAAPRILKPAEQKMVRFLLRAGADILVRSGGLLQGLQGYSDLVLDGDFSLNATNQLTARYLLAAGLRRLAPTHDLNGQQIADLAAVLPVGSLEVIAYHHMPVFHTEHCVFCRFLSTGSSFRDCGRPCESHKVALRDAAGRAHPVMADIGCRNTVFGAEAQVGTEWLAAWQRAGVQDLRIEFVHETGHDVTQVVSTFHQLLGGVLSPAQAKESLRAVAAQGVTSGSLYVPKDFRSLPDLG